jgi:hypothetical protein
MNLRPIHLTSFCALAILLAAGISPLRAQQPGPMVPPASTKIPAPPPPKKPDPPAIPPEEIIKKFAAKEDEMFRAIQGYTFQKSVRIEEMGAGNKPTGQLEIVTQITITPDGKVYEKPVRRSASTLHNLDLERGDSEILATTPLFPLTTSQLPNYQISFLGKQPLDELSAYAFSVKPRMLDRQHAYFSGAVWVDVDDLVIVKTIGEWLTEEGDVTAATLPFSVFETYREQVGKNLWFPAYSSSYGTAGDDHVPIRIIVRWTEYGPAGTATPATAPTPEGAPAAKFLP